MNQEQMMNAIRKVLKKTGTYTGEKDVHMVYETGNVETGYDFLLQWPSGPAISFFQIEPYTARSIVNNWLKGTRFEKWYNFYRNENLEFIDDLEQSLFLSIFLCRMQYWFDSPLSIPETQDERASFWVEHYNKGGKGSKKKFLDANKKNAYKK